MNIRVFKRFLLILLLLLSILGFMGYKFGIIDRLLHDYEEKKLAEELTQIKQSVDTNSSASVDPEQTSSPGQKTADPSPMPVPGGIQPGQSAVSLVQSHRPFARDITDEEIDSMVRQAVTLAGGFQGLIRDGQTVVLKPNLVQKHSDVTGKLFDRQLNGITTDWRVTKAVAGLVRELNPSGKVYVMEGSAGDKTRDCMEYFHYTREYIPGVDEFIAIEEDSGGWQEFNSPGLVKVSLPNGLLHKEYYLNKKYKEADVLISIPCLKNNSGTVITGGIKNVSIGATPANIYGPAAGNLSRTKMVSHSLTKDDLQRWIFDYYMCRPVDFVVMDGLEGFQNGPAPYKKDSEITDKMNMRLIMAGRDAVAVDTTEALVTGWDPRSANYLRYLESSGMGNLNTARITVAGEQVDAVRKDFATKIANSGGIQITDRSAPRLSIDKAEVNGEKLALSLTTDKETVKAEVYIDGILAGPVFTSGFEDMSVDMGSIAKGGHELRVCVYDRFLNHSEQTIQITK